MKICLVDCYCNFEFVLNDFQVIFSDTPGIIKPSYELQNAMMKFVYSAVDDADVILYMVEVGEKEPKNEDIFKQVKKSKQPIIILINNDFICENPGFISIP